MARDFLWRRRWTDYNTGSEGFLADPVNGIWAKEWMNLATLTTGQTLTRVILRAQYWRLSSDAGDSESIAFGPVIIGVYLAADPTVLPTLNPWIDQGNQSWLWWESKSVQTEFPKSDSADNVELIEFELDTNAQRKAKVNASGNTAVWFMWAQRYATPFSQPGWQISQISASVGVLQP